jgi:hypothetical protein
MWPSRPPTTSTVPIASWLGVTASSRAVWMAKEVFMDFAFACARTACVTSVRFFRYEGLIVKLVYVGFTVCW